VFGLARLAGRTVIARPAEPPNGPDKLDVIDPIRTPWKPENRRIFAAANGVGC
jgi:hypothetical protein